MRRRPLLVASSLLSLAPFLGSCGGCGCSKSDDSARGTAESPEKAAPGDPASPASARLYQPAPAADASIAGKVTLEGDPPKLPPLTFDADPVCSQAHGGTKVPKEEIVAKGGKLQNVLVYAKSSSGALEGLRFETPTTPFLLDQKGCMYAPHVFGVMAGQPITIRSSDPTPHNIKCQPRKNDGFNFSQAKPGEDTRSFAREEVTPPIRLECNVHPWMNGYAGVLSHPFFAVTGEDGTYSIPGLPPGDYEIVAWQESTKLDGPRTEKVTLGPKESRTLDFTFKVK